MWLRQEQGYFPAQISGAEGVPSVWGRSPLSLGGQGSGQALARIYIIPDVDRGTRHNFFLVFFPQVKNSSPWRGLWITNL